MRREKTLFDADRMSLDEAVQMTADSLIAYGAQYRVWCVAFSGGKDSTATLAVVVWLIVTGKVPAPDALFVIYADTRQELPPLHDAAMAMLAEVRGRGYGTRPNKWTGDELPGNADVPQLYGDGTLQRHLFGE